MVSPMRKTEDHDEAVNQRLKRLLQRFSQKTLSSIFGVWREVAEFQRSVQKLEAVLEPCWDIWDQPSHQRPATALSAVLALLQKLPYFAALCAEAQHFVAAHAKLQVLSDASEMPCNEADTQRLYVVLCGQVTLLHGDPSQPQLQQLLQAAKQQIDNSHSPTAATLTTASAAASASAVPSSNTASLKIASGLTSSSKPQARSVGIWQQVRECVSAGQKRKIHSSLQEEITSSAIDLCSSTQVRLADTAAAEAGMECAVLDVGSLVSSVTVQTVKVGVTFCGHQFPSAPPTSFTAAAGYSTEDAPQLSQLPNSCLAAVAQPNTVAALLVLSKAAYMEAMRLHHEDHVSRVVDMACRIPSLRHTPIKELYRLAAHMKEANYEPGQVILRQGKEVADVHFLTSGTVQLTYLPPATGQQPHPTLMVLGTRGPGSVLGDDAMRERKIAVGVVAVTSVAMLKVAPQKLLSYLDPLTLRLFGRLRQQQPPKQQMLIQAALTDTCEQSLQHSPQHQLRAVVLDQVYESAPMPSTVVRPGDSAYEKLQEQVTDSQKPPWHSVKREDRAATNKDAINHLCSPRHGSHKSMVGTGRTLLVQGPGMATGNQTLALSGAGTCVSHGVSHVCGPEELTSWQGGLPRGLTLEMCAGLPQTASVMQLIGLIRDTEDVRKLHIEPTTQSAIADTPTKQSEPVPGSLTCDLAADAVSASVHTELLESSGVAVLQLKVPPGQAPVSGAALAGALDDVAAAWAAVTYDEGLQLVRWSACRWIMLAELEPGASKRSGLEGLAGAVLSAAARLTGVMQRSVDVLPVVTLSAGIASGSCFVQREAGNFVFSISGRAFDAAEQLCAEAEAASATALPKAHRDSSHSTVLTTDGVAAVLQTNFWLEPCGGGSCLISARPSMPPTQGQRPASPPGFGAPISPSRTTLGPGRNTIMGMSGSLLNPTTPKTPGGGLLLPNWGKAQNERRQMRRKIEALQDLFTGAGDGLPPPPEYMLSQPPPVTRSRPRSGTVSHPAHSAGGTQGVTSSNRTVNFLEGAGVSSSGAGANASSSSGSGKKGFKPRLTISVDGDAASAAAGGAASTPKAGSAAKTPGSKTPSTARLVTTGSKDEDSHALLTPTLVMDSPIWRRQQQQGSAAGRHQQPGLANANKSAACNTPGSAGSGICSRQTAAGQPFGPRQSVKQQVWQEIQQMRANSDEIPSSPVGDYPARLIPAATVAAHAGHSPMLLHTQAGELVSINSINSNSSGAGLWGHSDDSGSGHTISSTAPSRTATSLAGVGAKGLRASFPGLPVSNFSGAGSLRHAALNRPRSAEPMNISNGDSSTNGERSKPAIQEPQHRRNSRLTSSMWGGGGTGGDSGAGSYSGSGGGNAHLHRPEQHAVKFRDGSIAGSAAGGSHIQEGLASKHSMLKPSHSRSTSIHHRSSNSGWSQQQQQQQEGLPNSQQALQSESSKHESLNSFCMSQSMVHAAVGEAGAAAQLEQQRQQALVMSACKGLGSYAAAEAYVAALPEGLMTVNLSAAGLSRLPSLARLSQLEYLSASFNKLDSLPPLIPNDAASLAAAAAAAADAGGNSSSSTGQSTDFFAGSTDGKDNTGTTTTNISSILDKLKQQLVSGAVSSLPATLSRLGLAYNRLDQIPMELPAALSQLTELDLSHNRLTELPATFGVLTSLKLLFLNHNQLVGLPGSFTRLYSLQFLDLSQNKFTQLPENLQKIPELVTLHLQHNQIQSLPSGFSQLSGLKCLGLGYNPNLVALPPGVLNGLSGLTSLDLAGCGLTDAQLAAAAAEAAGSDQQLVTGDVPSSGTCQEQQQQQHQSFVTEAVVEAPSDMLSPQNAASSETQRLKILPELEVLDLSNNQLQELPNWLPSRLKRLSASNNQINKLSENLSCKLVQLVVLDLHDNELLEVPKELMFLEHIQILALSGNPGLDAELVESGKSDRHGAGSPEKSERLGQVSAIPSGRSGLSSARISKVEKTKELGESGMAWVYQWLAQRKAAAAATLMRGAHQQRQQKQEQVTSSLGNHSAGLLPGIRQTVIIESGRVL